MVDWEIYWSPDAREDVRTVVEYIAAQGDAVNAMCLFDRLVARADSLARMPMRGHALPGFGLPADPPPLEVIEYPWRIVYACVKEHRRVVIAAVVDGRRDVARVLLERFAKGSSGLS
jgi:plasmid stabilization system protein ParE